MATETWTVRIDGRVAREPRAAAYAVVIERLDLGAYEEAECLEPTTNNPAEYTALVKALERAAALGGRRLEIFSDSELLVKQMNGEYRVKNEELKALFDMAQEQLRSFEQVTIRHVRREQNKRADALCNEALDGKPRPPSASPVARRGGDEKAERVSTDVRRQVVERLNRAATEWARGDATRPDPSAVWDELWAIVTRAVAADPHVDLTRAWVYDGDGRHRSGRHHFGWGVVSRWDAFVGATVSPICL